MSYAFNLLRGWESDQTEQAFKGFHNKVLSDAQQLHGYCKRMEGILAAFHVELTKARALNERFYDHYYERETRWVECFLDPWED